MAAVTLTHDDITLALEFGWPDSEWAYDGNGTSLDSVTDNGVLISRGLEWHDKTQKAPSLADLSKALPAAHAAAALAVLTVQRDGLLAASDWTQLPDSPLGDTAKTAWTSYRQQLRDFPNQKGFDPANPPAWPTPPNV